MSSEVPGTRRRGEALVHAILDAAWDQLVEAGYERFTFDLVAVRAGTSKPVLYRRWSDRADLLRATVRRHGETRIAIEVPDTGGVRQDLLDYLAAANRERVDDILLLSNLITGQTGQADQVTPDEIRRELLGDRVTGAQQIIDRGAARGEIDPDRVTPRIAQLPFDLFRLEVVTTLRAVPDHVRRQIVDDIFLPLVEFR